MPDLKMIKSQFITILILSLMALPALAQSERFVRGRILVQTKDGISDQILDQVLKIHGGQRRHKISGINVHIVALPAQANERAVVMALTKNPNIQAAELDQLLAPPSPQMTANDSLYPNAWHLPMIGAPAAWDISLGTGVTVAILDTGVDGTHPDLAGKMVPGWNFWDNNSNTSDVHGHGTLVAGTVGAVSNNGSGVTAVAWNSLLMPIRISGLDGYGSWSAMASGLTWAADRGARVANISYSSAVSSSSVISAAQYFRSKGGVVVNAGGNSGAFDGSAPSEALVSVAATDSSNNRASWSTWGAFVDVCAPGVGIWTTARGGGYSAVSGTSFSSPITAAVVALMMSANKSITPDQIVSILKSTALDLGVSGADPYYGAGRVNAFAAVQAAVTQAPIPTPTPTPTPTDTVAPVITSLSPTEGSRVSGNKVTIRATASDNIGVSSIKLFIDDKLMATQSGSSLSYSWNLRKVSSGLHRLTVTAQDAAGNLTSASVQVSK